ALPLRAPRARSVPRRLRRHPRPAPGGEPPGRPLRRGVGRLRGRQRLVAQERRQGRAPRARLGGRGARPPARDARLPGRRGPRRYRRGPPDRALGRRGRLQGDRLARRDAAPRRDRRPRRPGADRREPREQPGHGARAVVGGAADPRARRLLHAAGAAGGGAVTGLDAEVDAVPRAGTADAPDACDLPLATGAMHARARPRAVVAVWVAQALLAVLGTWPAVALVRGVAGRDPRGAAPLWEPG